MTKHLQSKWQPNHSQLYLSAKPAKIWSMVDIKPTVSTAIEHVSMPTVEGHQLWTRKSGFCSSCRSEWGFNIWTSNPPVTLRSSHLPYLHRCLMHFTDGIMRMQGQIHFLILNRTYSWPEWISVFPSSLCYSLLFSPTTLISTVQ